MTATPVSPKAVIIEGTHIKSKADLDGVTNDGLLKFYNSATGKSTTKFASRAKGIEQVWLLIADRVRSSLPAVAATKAPTEKPAQQKAPTIAQKLAAAKAAQTPATKPAPKQKPEKAPKAPKEPKVKAEKKARKPRGISFNFLAKAGEDGKADIKKIRPGTKRALIIDLLSRPNGATFDECRKETDWDVKTCYEGIRLLHFYVGYGIEQQGDRIKLHTRVTAEA